MILLLLLSVALADFTGHWVGEGTMTAESNSFICEFDFKIDQHSEVVHVLSQYVGCDDLGVRWQPYSANIINGELFNTKTGIYGGTINQSQVRVNYLMSPESAPYIINADKLTEDSANFEMILYGTDGPKVFKAIMNKK
jgi:hypothetical protein